MDERLQRLQERLYPASITKVQFSAQALTVFSPIHGRFHSKLGSTFSLDLGLGFGLVQTAEDLDALDADGDSLALATANQVHPTLTWIAGPRIGLGKQLSATIRVRGAHWIETVESLYLEQMSVLQGTVGIARAF